VYALLTIVPLALLVFALVDAIMTDDSQVKHLPKIWWIVLIVILPLAGSIAWLIAGKDRGLARSENVAFGDPRRHEPVAERLMTEAEELAKIEREIERSEREARIRRLEAEIAARKREGS
jgi:hypothetical protein